VFGKATPKAKTKEEKDSEQVREPKPHFPPNACSAHHISRSWRYRYTAGDPRKAACLGKIKDVIDSYRCAHTMTIIPRENRSPWHYASLQRLQRLQCRKPAGPIEAKCHEQPLQSRRRRLREGRRTSRRQRACAEAPCTRPRTAPCSTTCPPASCRTATHAALRTTIVPMGGAAVRLSIVLWDTPASIVATRAAPMHHDVTHAASPRTPQATVVVLEGVPPPIAVPAVVPGLPVHLPFPNHPKRFLGLDVIGEGFRRVLLIPPIGPESWLNRLHGMAKAFHITFEYAAVSHRRTTVSFGCKRSLFSFEQDAVRPLLLSDVEEYMLGLDSRIMTPRGGWCIEGYGPSYRARLEHAAFRIYCMALNALADDESLIGGIMRRCHTWRFSTPFHPYVPYMIPDSHLESTFDPTKIDLWIRHHVRQHLVIRCKRGESCTCMCGSYDRRGTGTCRAVCCRVVGLQTPRRYRRGCSGRRWARAVCNGNTRTCCGGTMCRTIRRPGSHSRWCRRGGG